MQSLSTPTVASKVKATLTWRTAPHAQLNLCDPAVAVSLKFKMSV